MMLHLIKIELRIKIYYFHLIVAEFLRSIIKVNPLTIVSVDLALELISLRPKLDYLFDQTNSCYLLVDHSLV